MSTNTEHYSLQIDQGSDIFNPLTSIFPNFQKIDTAMWNNKLGGIVTGTHLLSGTVHAITVSDAEGFSVFRFVATANYTAGDTFTVNGTPVTATTTAGTSLGTGCFVINQSVIGCLVGTQLTLYVADSGATAPDAEKLGGQLPSYYATAEQFTGVQAIANNALQTANSANTTAAGASAIAQQAQQAATAASIKKLWVNGTPSQAFTAQDIPISNLSQYNTLILVYSATLTESAAQISTGVVYLTSDFPKATPTFSVSGTQANRTFTANFSVGTITASGGTVNTSANNNGIIPLYILGVTTS